MTTVPPALPTPTPATAPPAPVIVRATAAPSTLAQLPANSTVDAQVLQAAARGQTTVLQTAVGLLTLRTPLVMPQGAQVTLDVLSLTQGGALLRIATLNGQPLGGPPPAPPQVAAGPATTPAGPPTGTPSTSGAGPAAAAHPPGHGILTATVVRAVGAAGGGFAPGTMLQATLISLQPPGGPVPPATGGIPGPATPGPGLGAGTAPTPPSTAPGATGPTGGGTPGGPMPGSFGPEPPGTGPRSGLSAGLATANDLATQARTGLNTILGRLGATFNTPGAGASPAGPGHPTATQSPGPTTAASTASPSGTTQSPGSQTVLMGTVQEGGTPNRMLLTTPVGTLALHLRMGVPPGSQITLGILSTTPPPGPGGAGAVQAGAGLSVPQGGTQGWPALTEAVELLSQRDTAAARALQQAIPQPGPQLAATLSSLTAVLRAGGDIRQWPGGPALDALDSSGAKGERLAQALRGDIRTLAGRSSESTGSEWRPMTLPIWDGADITPISIITRVRGGRLRDTDDQDESTEGGGDPGDRFVVDLTLSQMGRLQIDGLMRTKARQLHLILRTTQTLPDSMRQDLSVIVETGLAALGLEGGLTFQTDGRFVEAAPAPLVPATPSPNDVIA